MSIPPYNKFRINTPSNVLAYQSGVFIPLPNANFDILAKVVGSFSYLVNEAYWREETKLGNMTVQETVQYFNKALNGMVYGDFCQLVADCITDPDSSANKALRNFELVIEPTTPPTTEVVTANLLTNCSQNEIYSQSLALVQVVNRVAVDMLENAQNQINDVLTVLKLVDFVPLLGDLPLSDDFADFAEEVREGGLASYNAGYDAGLELELACNIYKRVCDCNMTIADVFAAYAETGLVNLITPDNILAVMMEQALPFTNNRSFALSVHALIMVGLCSGGGVAGIKGMTGLKALISKTDVYPVPASCVCVTVDGCHDYESIFTSVVAGTDEGSYVSANTGLASFRFAFGADVVVNSGNIQTYRAGTIPVLLNRYSVKGYKDGVLVKTYFNYSANDGGYVWYTDSFDGSLDVVDEIVYEMSTNFLHGVKGEICVTEI